MIQEVIKPQTHKYTNTYNFDEVFEATKKYFNGDELAATTWINKYALQNKNGEYLEKSPADMHRRMAKEFARIEQKYPHKTNKELSDYGQKRPVLTEQRIFDLFDHFRYVIPQGSIMFGLGNDQVIVHYQIV